MQLDPDPVESKFWRKRNVDIVNVSLDAYVSRLQARVEALPPEGGVL